MSSSLRRSFRPSTTLIGRWLARPETFHLVHSTLMGLSFFPQLASWGAKLWWEADQVPAARFEAWDNFFTGLSLIAFYPWLGLVASTCYAALVLRKAKAVFLGIFVLIVSFMLMAIGITLMGYD